MTTIACNRSEMAADSRFTCEGAGTDAFPTDKLYKIGDSIFGESGETGSSRLISWLQRGRPGEGPEFHHEDDRKEFLLLELNAKGIFVWDDALFQFPVREKNFAIGSGRKVALYCMRYHGMTPAQAVEEAAKVDVWTQGPVSVMRLADL